MLKKVSVVLLAATTMIAPMVVHAADEDIKELRNDTRAKDWYVVKNDTLRNIKTFAKQEDGKRIRSFKIEATMDCSLDTLARVQFDIENVKRWFWETKESRLLKKVSNTEFYFYQVYNAPLTIPDRDVIVHAVVEPYSPKKGYMLIRFNAVPDFMPPQSGLTRVLAQDMTIKFTPITKEHTRLESEGYIDPGGTVPAWTINFVQRSAPYTSTLGMQRMIQLPYYRNDEEASPFTIRE